MKCNMRIVHQGDSYGLRYGLVHNLEQPMAEFYDAAYVGNPNFDPLGQFVSRYMLSTLTDYRVGLSEHGLNLDGGVPTWRLSGTQMTTFFALLDAGVNEGSI